ncbi:MAG: ribonuclease III [Chloroflexi bacterium]|jgi:ribonuclease-3|nr:ribonuclease III [Chloroflexota bacterium]
MIESAGINALRRKLPQNFKDDFLLTRALTHRSYLNENKHVLEDNERLEFLGDSILNFIVAEWLYQNFSEKREGFLTKVRAALVHTYQLSAFARKIGLGPALLVGKGEDSAGGRERDAILCDTFEALIAAIYLDTNMDTVKNFIIPFLEDESEEILKSHGEEDVKSRLQEWAQAQGYPSPNYVVVNESGPDHAKTFQVVAVINEREIASGLGKTKQQAEKDAASNSIKKLGFEHL